MCDFLVKSGVKYRFKFENIGKRNIIDVGVIVRLRIQGLKQDLPQNWEIIYVPTSSLEHKQIAMFKGVSNSICSRQTGRFIPVEQIVPR